MRVSAGGSEPYIAELSGQPSYGLRYSTNSRYAPAAYTSVLKIPNTWNSRGQRSVEVSERSERGQYETVEVISCSVREWNGASGNKAFYITNIGNR